MEVLLTLFGVLVVCLPFVYLYTKLVTYGYLKAKRLFHNRYMEKPNHGQQEHRET